jgi:predicted RNA-binding protein with PIN domain
MPYLIDGHNLVPHVGLTLAMPDDEMDLVHLLQEFSRVRRQQVEVYFDGAPVGNAGARRLGTVTARFVGIGTSADSAIKARLSQLGRGARNWTVVSSDREVQRSARTARAACLSSDEFARRLRGLQPSNGSSGNDQPGRDGVGLSESEVEKWLQAFRKRK